MFILSTQVFLFSWTLTSVLLQKKKKILEQHKCICTRDVPMILLKLKRVLQLPSKSEKNNFRKLFYFYRDEEDDKETKLICAWAIVGAFHEFISSWTAYKEFLICSPE